MISYMGFNTYSENIGYNEYPVEFEDIKAFEHQSSFSSLRSNTKISETVELLSLNSSSSSSNIYITKASGSFKIPNLNFGKIKSVNFDEKKIKNASTFKKLNRGGGLLKNKKINNENMINSTNNIIEIENKIDDVDFLSKFKESQKKIVEGLKGDKKEENKDNSNNNLRRSTLKNGILFDDVKDDNDEYYDDEDEGE